MRTLSWQKHDFEATGREDMRDQLHQLNAYRGDEQPYQLKNNSEITCERSGTSMPTEP
jgi:exonuclease I